MEKLKGQSGFTLIEMIIVVIILGILALIIIPQVSVSTNDAKLSTLQTNLSTVRNSLELYYHQHSQTYPGGDLTVTKPTGVATNAEVFAAQLTRYTNSDGDISNSYGSSTFSLGPYIKNGKLPSNPINNQNDVIIDTTETDITKRDSAGSDNAWKFYTNTGVFIAADGDPGEHDDL